MPLENRSFHDVGPFGNNVYVISDPKSRETAVVDVGFEPERVIELAAREGLRVRWLLATHAHYDHVAAMLTVQRAVGGEFALHPADRPLLAAVAIQGSMFGLPPVDVPEVALELAEGMRVPLGDQFIDVLHTPGHAPGHVTFRHGETLWSGDVLFAGSVGRTDIPYGDWGTLVESIRSLIERFPPETVVYSGHGPETTLGAELERNPFLDELRVS
jgi:hydroxyacylglutathione hydrolase